MKLKIYYDSFCPLCAIEMKHLITADKLNHLELIDLHQQNFQYLHPQINKAEAMNILHAEFINEGKPPELLLGLDVTHKAWSLVGRGWRTGFLRWPIIKPIADTLYRFFARHRYSISKVLTGKSRLDASCSSGYCQQKK